MHRKIFPAILLLALTVVLLPPSAGRVQARAAAPNHMNAVLRGQFRPRTNHLAYADVWGEGNYAYLASYASSGLYIVDVSDPNAPRQAGFYEPSGGADLKDVVVIDGIAYCSNDTNRGVFIVDVRDPANPRELSNITAAQSGHRRVHELFVADNYLYEADSFTRVIKVFDVKNATQPFFVRDIVTTDPQFIHAMVVVNGRLYASGFGGTTDIYDVRNVGAQPPPLLGTVMTGSSSHSSWPSNDGKILASCRERPGGGLDLFDISDPANARPLSTVTAESLGLSAFSGHNPYIVGHMVFVSWYQAGVVALDISDPTHPRLVGVYDTYDGTTNGYEGCWGVFPFSGFDRVLASDLDGGLFVIDFSAAIAGPRTVSAASYSASAIAGRSIVSAFGANLAATTQAATGVPLPITLAGTSVRVTDIAGAERLAPLFFVSPTQINYQIPPGTLPGPAALRITDAGGRVALGTAIVSTFAPAIFTFDQSGRGAAVALDGFNFTGPPYAARRANGEPNILALYGTGFGSDATDIDRNVALNFTASVGGRSAAVQYAGRAPGLIGVNQLNLVLPTGLAAGTHPVVVSRNGVVANQTTIALR